MTEQLIDITIHTQVQAGDLYILAEVNNWQETVPSEVTPAVYEGETLVTPAIYEQIPNPYTVQMWVDDYIGGIIADKINEARRIYNNNERRKAEQAEEKERQARIKGNTSTSFEIVSG